MRDPSDPAVELAQQRVGQVLRGKWRLDRLLGVGGMAAVYAGTHRNGLRGAVKILHPEVSRSERTRERFLREGYAANKVDHPGAVRVLDDDVAEDGSVFLVMELLEGEDWDQRRLARGKIPVPEVLDVVDQLLDVLAVAHDKGIVHRDLKPENMFITKEGKVKVLDFGIARLVELSQGSRGTQTGTTLGTPAFMPPEQALGDWAQVDARSDLWAVGATMYAALSGRLVHEADTMSKVLLSAMTQPAAPLDVVAPEVPPAICAVVNRALAFQQADRWPDARTMREALRAAGASSARAEPAGQAIEPTAPGMTHAPMASDSVTTVAAAVQATTTPSGPTWVVTPPAAPPQVTTPSSPGVPPPSYASPPAFAHRPASSTGSLEGLQRPAQRARNARLVVIGAMVVTSVGLGATLLWLATRSPSGATDASSNAVTTGASPSHAAQGPASTSVPTVASTAPSEPAEPPSSATTPSTATSVPPSTVAPAPPSRPSAVPTGTVPRTVTAKAPATASTTTNIFKGRE